MNEAGAFLYYAFGVQINISMLQIKIVKAMEYR